MGPPALRMDAGRTRERRDLGARGCRRCVGHPRRAHRRLASWRSHKPQADGDANVMVGEESEKRCGVAGGIPLRGKTVRVRLLLSTEAFSEQKAVGGYQRFYGRTNTWMSQPGATEHALTLEWDEPRQLRSIRLALRRRHRRRAQHPASPSHAGPDLPRARAGLRARDAVGDQWHEVVRVEANRRRQRVHEVSQTADALRLRVLATNGAPQARVVSLRVY